MKGDRINDHERELWVLNDEGLYHDQKRSRLSMREYIRQNRSMIDDVIRGRIGGRDNPVNPLESPVGHFVTAHPWISTLIGTAALGGAGWLGAYLMSRVVAPKSTAIIPSTDTTPAPKSTSTTTTSSTPTFDAAKAVTFTIPSGGKSFPLGTSFNLVDGSTGLPVTAEFEPPTGILAAGPSAGTYVCVGQGTAKFDFADGTHTTVVVTAAGTAGVSGAPKTQTRRLLPPVLFPFRALLQGA